MGTNIRPEVSKKKEYWIPKHRYYELKHFVMQYPEWEEYLSDTNWFGQIPPTDVDKVQLGAVSDPTWQIVKRQMLYSNHLKLVETAADSTDGEYGKFILNRIISGDAYNEATDGVIISRSKYYELYRKFFYILDCLRK